LEVDEDGGIGLAAKQGRVVDTQHAGSGRNGDRRVARSQAGFRQRERRADTTRRAASPSSRVVKQANQPEGRSEPRAPSCRVAPGGILRARAGSQEDER
jgi:hypothetical protein